MTNDALFIDIDYARADKYRQNTCGDSFLSKRFPEEGRLIAVLSDGLGSGIKASILSSMTATMFLKFIAAGRDIQKSAEVIMDSLPVCKKRKISYATFSVIDCFENENAKIVEDGNPEFLFIRDGKVLEPTSSVISSKKFKDRHLHVYEIKLQPEDRLIFCSDGVTQAGLGTRELKLGWRREGLIHFALERIKASPTLSSRELAEAVVREARSKEISSQPQDDISCAALYFRKPRMTLIFTGPPYLQTRDAECANTLERFKGKKIICGGTTANLVSRELNRPVKTEAGRNSGNLPACSEMEGMDLITEGVMTLSRTTEYLESGQTQFPKDPAGRLAVLLQDSDCIDFLVGSKMNQAHQDPDLPFELEIRKPLIKRMSVILREKYLKKVNITFV